MIKPFCKLLLFSICCLQGVKGYSQIPKLASYDEKKIHFGFLIGYNQMLFDLKLKENNPIRDTVLNATSFYSPGFDVAIVSDLKLTEYVNLRFNPGLSFTERTIQFYTSNPDYFFTGKSFTKSSESVLVNVPLEFKIRSQRWKNFRPYLITGGRYTFDLAVFREIKEHTENDILQIKPHDFLITGGFGFDFYLTYFKFAIEIKMALGTQDLLLHKDNSLVNSIEKLTSRIFNFSLTFE